MATEILAVGTNTTPSSDLLVEDGNSVTVALKGANGHVEIQLKDGGGDYHSVKALTPATPWAVLDAPGTYRFVRRAGGNGVGVFRGAAGGLGQGAARGWGFDVAVTPTVTNGAYSAGDIMGALMTFANVARAIDEPIVVTGVQISCKAAVVPSLTLVLLNADPTNTTKTDNAAYSLNAADAFKVIKALPLVTLGAAWVDHGTPNTLSLDNLGIVCKPVSGGRDIYGLLVDGTGVTLTSTSDIQVRLRGIGA